MTKVGQYLLTVRGVWEPPLHFILEAEKDNELTQMIEFWGYKKGIEIIVAEIKEVHPLKGDK